MIVDFPKPGGFASLTTTTPKLDSVPLGKVLRGLSDRLSIEDPALVDDSLELFLDENTRFANASRVASLSCPHALKAWAAERLPSIGISYGISNRINQKEIEANLDEQAPLCLVEFAEDLSLIACYCREITELKIEGNPHSHGLEFRFAFYGSTKSEPREIIEAASIHALLNEGVRNNCLRKRVFASEGKIEAECIALRKKVRLGFSPVF
ncbi:hypothetical protein [Pelagicoccus albus]|uniref:Uncharacterized protein n=1 Tax=Pelagicoccus albus TaxID=415222 RepID=A0A7X1B947_9BACT|nr:hypothetical protein [Pelagicoccus albus]MBC2607629.1 hypothetical protein [Pelagicoccus albus]